MFRSKTVYTLVCDGCGKIGEFETLVEATEDWHFDEWLQSLGYRYYALTCSDACRTKMDGIFVNNMKALKRGEIPLDVAAKSMPSVNVGFTLSDDTVMGITKLVDKIKKR